MNGSNAHQRFFFFRSLTLNRNIQAKPLELDVKAVGLILSRYYQYHIPFGDDFHYLPYGPAATFSRKYTARTYTNPNWMYSLATLPYLNHGLFPIYSQSLAITEGQTAGTLYASYITKNKGYLLDPEISSRLIAWFCDQAFIPVTLRAFVEKYKDIHRLALAVNIREFSSVIPNVRQNIDGDVTKKIKASFKKNGILAPIDEPLFPIGFDYLAAEMGYVLDSEPLQLWGP